MVREEELVQKAKEVREALIEMAAREIDATHIEVGQIKAKDDTRKLLTVRVGGANRYVPYQGHDTSEFTVGDYWAIIFDDYGTIRLGWWVANNAGGGTIPFRPHNLLDGDAHPDTVAQAVTRGSVIVGDSTPEWNELPIGAAGRYLRSDGTDPAYAQIPASEVVNTPAGGIAATDVQAALNELDTEKAGIADAETISADWTWGTDKKIYFRDVAIYIASLNDGFLDLVADTAIRLTTPYVDIQGISARLRLSDNNAVNYTQTLAYIEFGFITGGWNRTGYIGFGSSNNDVLYISNEDGANIALMGANVGIGVTGPAEHLHVYHTGAGVSALLLETAGGGAADDAILKLKSDTQEWWCGLVDAGGTNFFSIFDLTAVAHRLLIDTAGNVFINESANAKMTQGLTINQGAYDDEILALKSSDVAHGITDYAETDTYLQVVKSSAGDGGAQIRGYSDATIGLDLWGLGNADDTTKGTTGRGYVNMWTFLRSGTTIGNPGADANLLTIGQGSSSRFIFDAEGSGHADVEWVAFQDYDDLALITDMELELMLGETEAQTSRRKALERAGIIGKDSWHMENGKPRAMVNFTKLSMLHHGALIQVAARLEMYERAFVELGIDPAMLTPN